MKGKGDNFTLIYGRVVECGDHYHGIIYTREKPARGFMTSPPYDTRAEADDALHVAIASIVGKYGGGMIHWPGKERILN